MAAAERDAATLAARTRTLTDVAAGAVARGDAVTVATGRTEFVGRARYARGDLLTIDGAAALVEVNLAAIDWMRIDRRATSGGQSSPHEAESFAARLGLLELSGEAVDIVTAGGHLRVPCVIAAVARDHVLARAGQGREWAIPMIRVAFVVRPHRPPTRQRR